MLRYPDWQYFKQTGWALLYLIWGRLCSHWRAHHLLLIGTHCHSLLSCPSQYTISTRWSNNILCPWGLWMATNIFTIHSRIPLVTVGTLKELIQSRCWPRRELLLLRWWLLLWSWHAARRHVSLMLSRWTAWLETTNCTPGHTLPVRNHTFFLYDRADWVTGPNVSLAKLRILSAILRKITAWSNHCCGVLIANSIVARGDSSVAETANAIHMWWGRRVICHFPVNFVKQNVSEF